MVVEANIRWLEQNPPSVVDMEKNKEVIKMLEDLKFKPIGSSSYDDRIIDDSSSMALNLNPTDRAVHRANVDHNGHSNDFRRAFVDVGPMNGIVPPSIVEVPASYNSQSRHSLNLNIPSYSSMGYNTDGTVLANNAFGGLNHNSGLSEPRNMLYIGTYNIGYGGLNPNPGLSEPRNVLYNGTYNIGSGGLNPNSGDNPNSYWLQQQSRHDGPSDYNRNDMARRDGPSDYNRNDMARHDGPSDYNRNDMARRDGPSDYNRNDMARRNGSSDIVRH